jgi:hypothetical protein
MNNKRKMKKKKKKKNCEQNKALFKNKVSLSPVFHYSNTKWTNTVIFPFVCLRQITCKAFYVPF